MKFSKVYLEVVNDNDGHGGMDTNGFVGNASSYLVDCIRIQFSYNMSIFMACVPSLSCYFVSLTICLLCWLATIPLSRYVVPL